MKHGITSIPVAAPRSAGPMSRRAAIAIRTAACALCALILTACFGSTNDNKPKRTGNPLSLSGATQEDWNMANDFAAHPAGTPGALMGAPAAPTVPVTPSAVTTPQHSH